MAYTPLEGKVALITGAGSGIGAGIAERFSEAGASVVIFDVNGESAVEMSSRLDQIRAARSLAVQGDVSKEAEVKAAVEKAVAKFGTVDILVNNAGIDVSGLAPEMSSSEWDRVLNVNLKGAFLFSKYVIPHMRGRGGAIVNISSVHAFVSNEGYAAYDASKAGMLAMTRTLALDHGRDGIRVNAICPGYINTQMTEEWFKGQPDPEATLNQVLAFHPLGRIGTPRDVAEASLFLASEAASFVSGTYLVVDGAMTIAGR
ncbi:MAG TPA: SDR family oxidoreductase [Terriglobia bacterium]|nr:SDR family oxidoreductase [Terriglobia bacterium]